MRRRNSKGSLTEAPYNHTLWLHFQSRFSQRPDKKHFHFAAPFDGEAAAGSDGYIPAISKRAAMFTVSPQMSKANLCWPTTPATTGPT